MSLSVPVQPETAGSLRALQRARCVLLGSTPTSQAPTPSVLKYSDVGLLFFLNEKQSMLHRAIGHFDVAEQPELEPLRLLVEFLSFSVGGLIVEAEKIDEAAIRVQQEINDTSLQLQRLDLELQYRKQRVGSTVNRVLSQHYKSRVSIPTVHACDQLDATASDELKEFSEGILELRRRLRMLQKLKGVLVQTQRLLHGRGSAVPAVEAEAIVNDLPMALTLRKVQHSIRDALVSLQSTCPSLDEEVPAVISLVEFILHIDVGLGAAADDVEAGIMHIRKLTALQVKEKKEEQLHALDSRNKQLSTSAMKYNDALRRGILRRGDGESSARLTLAGGHISTVPSASTETDEFLSLYCS